MNVPDSLSTPLSFPAVAYRLARARPQRIAVRCGDLALTWADLDTASSRIARALAARGTSTGDFVTLKLPNGLEFFQACFAVWKIGAIPQPVSSKIVPEELKALLSLAAPRVVVASEPSDDGHVATVAQLLDAETNGSPLPDIVSPAWKAPMSGGSTGRPKLIVSGQPAVTSELMTTFWRLSADDVALMTAPLSHNAPFSTMSLALTAGAEIVLMARFDAEAMLAEIARRRVTWLYVVPTMMQRVARLPQEVRNRFDLSSLKTVWHMAAPCPAWLKSFWIDWLGPETVLELYAGTEAQATTMLDGQEWLAHPGSVGRVVQGEMKILGEDGCEVSTGTIGEVFMRPSDPSAPTYRYIGAEARRLGDWESLGDMGWMDAEGYLYLGDRRSDMILVGGTNIYPAEIEGALDEHPDVLSSAVVGLPDADSGSRLHAIVQTGRSVDQADLLAFLEPKLAPYKRPRSIEFVDEPLRDAAGKVRRSQLREARLGGV